MVRLILMLCVLSMALYNSCTSPSPEEKKVKQSSPHNMEDTNQALYAKLKKPENGFNSAYVDKNGNLWLGSFGEGVYRFDGQTFTLFNQDNGFCNNEIHCVHQDLEGLIWFGTSNGLCYYDGDSFTSIPIPFSDTSSLWLDKVYPIINPNAVHAFIQSKDGTYWIGTGGGGAYRFDGKTFTPFLKNQGKKYDSTYHNWISDIAEDQNGNIWFASMSYGGLNRFDGTSFSNFLKDDGLSDDMIRKIYITSDGNVWLGFNGNRESALTLYDGNSFHIFSTNRTCHRSILAILEDSSGKIWLGGEDGVCLFNNNEFIPFLNKNNETFSGINFIVEDQQNNIWLGGRKGLWLFNGKNLVQITQ